MTERDDYRRLWGFHPPLKPFPAQVGRNPEGGDALAAPSRSDEHAVGEADAPKGTDHD